MEDANAIYSVLVLGKIEGIEVTPDEILHLLDHLADVRDVILVILVRHEIRFLGVNAVPG